MKKILSISIVAVVILSMFSFFALAGCTTAAVETTAAAAETTAAAAAETTAAAAGGPSIKVPTGLKIGVNMFLGSNEWNATALEGIKAAFGPDNEIISLDPNGDVQKGAENLVTLVASKPDLIIVTVGDNASYQQGIMAAADAGIPIIDIEAALYGPTVKTHLWADQQVNGILNANNVVSYLAATHGGLAEGNVVELYNPTVSTLDTRRNAFMNKLALYPDIKVVGNIVYEPTNPTESSRIATEAYLQANADKVDVLTAYFGEPVVGAVEGINNLGLGDKIKMTGIDAFEPVLNQMRAGKPVNAAVQQDGYAIGFVGALVGMKVLAGEEVAFQYIMPLVSIYNKFPGKADNFPAEGRIKIACPDEFKAAGLDWGY